MTTAILVQSQANVLQEAVRMGGVIIRIPKNVKVSYSG